MQASTTDITLFLVITTLIMLLLTAFIISMIFAYQRKQIRYLDSLNNLKSDYEKNLLHTQVEVQEQTFQSISREIHDNISLSLTLAKLQLASIENEVVLSRFHTITEVKDLISASIDNLRDISRSLNPKTISEQGLIYALTKEIQRIKTFSGLTIDFRVTGNCVYMDCDKELITFRVVQEAFNNILKHAHARSASLWLDYDEECVRVSVSDNGKGFRYAHIKMDANGLSNMEKRIEACNGVLDIASDPQSGTRINFSIPY